MLLNVDFTKEVGTGFTKALSADKFLSLETRPKSANESNLFSFIKNISGYLSSFLCHLEISCNSQRFPGSHQEVGNHVSFLFSAFLVMHQHICWSLAIILPYLICPSCSTIPFSIFLRHSYRAPSTLNMHK